MPLTDLSSAQHFGWKSNAEPVACSDCLEFGPRGEWPPTGHPLTTPPPSCLWICWHRRDLAAAALSNLPFFHRYFWTLVILGGPDGKLSGACRFCPLISLAMRGPPIGEGACFFRPRRPRRGGFRTGRACQAPRAEEVRRGLSPTCPRPAAPEPLAGLIANRRLQTGLPGPKSTTAALLRAAAFGDAAPGRRRILCSDRIRKKGFSALNRKHACPKEAYRPEVSAKVYALPPGAR